MTVNSTDIPTLPLPSGAHIPMLGFGTWQIRDQDAYDSVTTALQAGYRHIDTATGYKNEAQVGRAIVDSDVPREEIFITTKLPPDAAGREEETIAASLQALGVDQVDLWLIHWPPEDASVSTWRRFVEIQKSGRVRDIGVSNYSPEQIDELIDATGVAPAVNQIRWAPAIFDADRLQHSRDRGVVLEGYSPFRASDLKDSTLTEIAKAHGVSVPQVIVRWHIEHEIVVIPKSTHADRIRGNIDVFGFSLNEDEVARLDALSGA
jgi:diketogulonate reductase-like aldo/keto reductase